MLANRPLLRAICNKKPSSATYLGRSSSGADATTYTFSSVSLGEGGHTRRIIVCVTGADNAAGNSVSTLTVGGISAQRFSGCEAHGFAVGSSDAEIWYADLDGSVGTTGDIVVTWSNSTFRCGVAWYMTTKDIRLAHVATSTSNPGSVTVMIPGGGFAIGVQMTYRTSAQPTHTWTGLVEDYDSGIEAGGSSHSGAYLAVDYGGGKFVDVTCTPSSFSSGGTVVAAFR